MSKKSNRYGYTIFAPIPELEDLIQKYRLQYNYFMKMRGIPAHVTIFYALSENNYIKNKELIHQLFRVLPNVLKNKKLTLERVQFEKSMVSIKFDKKSEEYLLKIQEILSEKLGLSNQNKKIKRPHVTLFTDRIPHNFKRGLEEKNQILEEIESKLPVTIQLHKIWFVKFNKNESNSRVLEEIRF